MSLLGLAAYCACFLGVCGAKSADAAGTFCPAPAVTRFAGERAAHRHLATRTASLARPQANDSDDDNDDNSAGVDLTATLDDDDVHVTGLIWKRLIVTAIATLQSGQQALTPEIALAQGSPVGDDSPRNATSLRSLNVCLQI